MWSPRPLVVSTVNSPLVPTKTAHFSIGEVALCSCIVQILCAVIVGVKRMVEWRCAMTLGVQRMVQRFFSSDCRFTASGTVTVCCDCRCTANVTVMFCCDCRCTVNCTLTLCCDCRCTWSETADLPLRQLAKLISDGLAWNYNKIF